MRSSRNLVALAAFGMLVVPSLAGAEEDVQEQLRDMQERMAQLEEKLEAASDDLEASNAKVEEQARVMERAGIENEESSSGISSFFEKVEVGGWIQASYWYNFNHLPDPTGASEGINFTGTGGNFANTGSFGLANPFNPDHDTFQLDQAWFEIHKPATAESRGGFALDITMGKTADLLGSPGAQVRTGGASLNPGNGDNVHVYQAYAEYLAPIGPGLRIKAGRFGTVIGYEVAQAVYNPNISRGLVYSALQPFNQDGVYASMDHANGISWGFGVVNNAIGVTNTDFDSEKVFMWNLGWSGDKFGISFNGLYGGDAALVTEPLPVQVANCGGVTGGLCNTTDNLGIINFVGTWDPSENLSTWFDVTYDFVDGDVGSGLDQYAVGVAFGGRLAITERTGFSIRGEYLYSNDNFIGIPVALLPVGGNTEDQDLWTITATLDHQLTDGLKIRGEVRYEEGGTSASGNGVFYNTAVDPATPPAAASVQADQVLIGLDVIYQF